MNLSSKKRRKPFDSEFFVVFSFFVQFNAGRVQVVFCFMQVSYNLLKKSLHTQNCIKRKTTLTLPAKNCKRKILRQKIQNCSKIRKSHTLFSLIHQSKHFLRNFHSIGKYSDSHPIGPKREMEWNAPHHGQNRT